MKQHLERAYERYPPEQHGGCFMATRWLERKIRGFKEEVSSIDVGNGNPITHCYGVLEDGRIVDTQIFQFALFLPIPRSAVKKGIFTREEHEKLLPRFKREQL